MKIIIVPLLVMVTIFIVTLSVIRVVRTKKNESLLIIGRDGLISLWVTTIVFLLFSLIGWFSAPNIKYEIIKNISYILFLTTSILSVFYGRKSKNDKT